MMWMSGGMVGVILWNSIEATRDELEIDATAMAQSAQRCVEYLARPNRMTRPGRDVNKSHLQRGRPDVPSCQCYQCCNQEP